MSDTETKECREAFDDWWVSDTRKAHYEIASAWPAFRAAWNTRTPEPVANSPVVTVEEIIAALSPVQTIICPEPASWSVADSFAKGCPLTPKQIRAMQAILSHLVSRGIGRSGE